MKPGMRLNDWDTGEIYLICKVNDDNSVEALDTYFEKTHINYDRIYKKMNLIDENKVDMFELSNFIRGWSTW